MVRKERVEGNLRENEFMLEVPKLKITTPVITGINPADEKAYDAALKNGVLLMTGTGIPGSPGNVVIYGHSSSDEPGNFSKIFGELNNLKTDDEIKIKKGGAEHIYMVTGNRVVEATDLSVLKQTSSQTITLMTCWPLGTDEKRLVVMGVRKY